MKILVISGFLGAGKTTFIKEMSNKTKRDFVVFENEYGDVDIDANILKGEGMNIWELTEGCICCTMKDDFASSILTIANTLDPEYLIVEPTGVGKLSNIINNIRKVQYERITLLKPITIIDGNSFDTFLSSYEDIYKDQIVNASNIIISKMENSDKENIEVLERNILHILNNESHKSNLSNTNESCKDIYTKNENNKNAFKQVLLKEHYKNMPKEWWMSLLNSYLDDGYEPSIIDENGLEMPESFSMKLCELENESKLLYLLDNIIRGKFGDIVRSKGTIKCGTSYLRYDIAGDRYAVTGSDDSNISEIVFIGRNINRKLLREEFQPIYKNAIKN